MTALPGLLRVTKKVSSLSICESANASTVMNCVEVVGPKINVPFVAIKSNPANAVPLIAWRLRSVGESQSRLLLDGLPTCANCHSFSADGKTLAGDWSIRGHAVSPPAGGDAGISA